MRTAVGRADSVLEGGRGSCLTSTAKPQGLPQSLAFLPARCRSLYSILFELGFQEVRCGAVLCRVLLYTELAGRHRNSAALGFCRQWGSSFPGLLRE